MSDALVSQVDLLASFAALTGTAARRGRGAGQLDVMRALLGESKTGREHLVEQAGALSVRQGTWKYIEPNNGPR